MGRYLVPLTMVAALAAFAVAAATAGAVEYRPAWWPAVVALVVLGGITPMISAVNFRIVPVFARRSWPSLAWLRLQVALLLAGAWTVYVARLERSEGLEIAGSGLALAGGVVFTINVVRLFRQPAGPLPPPPLPFPEQATVDRLATRFTRLAGIYLLVGLGVGFATSIEQPSSGRWDLVWAHAMLVGFFLSMASGVCYHVLPRWTTGRWWAIWPIRLHLLAVVVGLPVMLLALATTNERLFLVAGPIQAAALVLFLASVLPFVRRLPSPTGAARGVAGTSLLGGVGLGATVAVSPEVGARLRLVHADLNLFGWAGLLISGFGYYLAPRFAGRPLRWRRLVGPQLGALGGGVALGAATLAWRAYGEPPAGLVVASHGLVAGAFVLLALVIGGTFLGQPELPQPVRVTLSSRRTEGGVGAISG
jgi:hypothetical protein